MSGYLLALVLHLQKIMLGFWIALNSMFGENWHLYYVRSSNPWTYYISIYLDLLLLFSLMFYTCQPISPLHVLFIPKYFFSNCKWYCTFNFSVRMFIATVLKYFFCMFILFPMTLLNLVTSRSFLVDSFWVLYVDNHIICKLG